MSLIATCHCGASRIELPRAPTAATKCNCTFCARTGAIWAYFAPGELIFLAQQDDATYKVADSLNEHHFCSTCGMHTWGSSPDWASMYNLDGTPKNGDPSSIPTARQFSINLNLIDDLDWSGITVTEVDGRHNW